MPLADVFIDRATAAELAWTLACNGDSEMESKLLIPDVEALIDVACKQTSDEAFYKRGEWQRLQNTRSSIGITAAGAAALDPKVIPESVRPSMGGQVKHDDPDSFPYPFECLENPDELYFPHLVTKIGYYSIVGSPGYATLLVADGSGAPITSGTLSVRACEHLDFDAINDVSKQLKDEFIKILAEMARSKFIQMVSGGGNARRETADS